MTDLPVKPRPLGLVSSGARYHDISLPIYNVTLTIVNASHSPVSYALPMESLGRKLRGVREAKPGLSLRRLAALTRIDKHSLSLYERDEQEPPFSRIKQLCAHLEMRAGYLFDEIEELRRRRPAEVAALESFRLFSQRTPRLTKVERTQLAALAASKEAPTTVDGWRGHLARVRASRGRPASAA